MKLTLDQTTQLNDYILTHYERYFENAPLSWKEDEFFLRNRPISVTSIYGQNEILNRNNVTTQEAGFWHRDKKYHRLRSVSFAIATDLRCNEVFEWEPVPVERLTQRHPVLYDSTDELTRNRVDIETLPLSDASGKEIKVYSPQGSYVLRRRPVIDQEVPTCGVLMNLSRIQELFHPNAPDYDDDMDLQALQQEHRQRTHRDPNLKCRVYPQAFLKTHGHLQANRLPHPFKDILSAINEKVRATGEELEDEEIDAHSQAPLVGIAFQAYNEAMHRIRPTAQYHDVQLGLITANLAGTYSTNEKAKRTSDNLYCQCQHRLPHENFAEKIKTPGLKREMRLENVYYVDMFALSVRHRKGR
jgi:hypothetical protein